MRTIPGKTLMSSPWRGWGFPYDDDASQSSDISVASPKYMIVAVGW